MPKNTRSSAAKRNPEAGKRGGNVQGSSRGEKGSPSPAETKSMSSNKPIPSPVSRSTLAVPGSRMGRAKHSGLLAKDEESAAATALDHEASHSGLPLGLSPTSPDTGLDSGDLPGREIYSIRKQPRGGKAGRGLKTTPGRSGKRTHDGEQAQVRDGSKKTAGNMSAEAENSDEEEGMEVDKPCFKSQQELAGSSDKAKMSRETELLSEDTEEDLSEVSDDEGLASIAASLNRGETVVRVTEGMVEGYFTAHSGKTGPTSDHTLAKLTRPRMDQESIQEALKTASTTISQLQTDCQSLLKEYRTLYPYWSFQMSNGFNILLYGLGSKTSLLEDFRGQYLTDTCHLVVNGYFPGLTVKHILNKLSCDLLGHSGTFKGYTEQAQYICSRFEDNQDNGGSDEVFILIHNIDGPMLRGEKAQSALSLLAQSPAIHFICSIDHINAPLIWDHNRLSRFNWVWHDVTTYQTYREETSYENSLLVQQSGTLALSSLTHVMKSLTPNARGIFELLANHQLEARSGEVGEGGPTAPIQYLGLSFQDCYLRCREKFLVNSDLTLRAQLTEFRDHKLIQSKKGSDGVEYLYIPVDDSTLTQFLEQLE